MRTLFVAYDYPPVGGGGVQRVSKILKYIQEFGIEPYVLSNEHALGRFLDNTLITCNHLDALPTLRIGGGSLRAFHLSRNHGIRLPTSAYPALLLNTVWHGDVYGQWFRDLKPRLATIVKEHDIECVWTTSPPNSTHYIGHWLKTKHGLPWVMDCRDAMVGKADSTATNTLTRFQEWHSRIQEKRFVRHANAIVSVSQPIIERMIARTGESYREKFKLIPNGYDEEDFGSLESFNKQNGDELKRLRLCYAGTFLGQRRPDEFIVALNRAIESGHIPADEIQIDFAGEYSESTLERIRQIHPKVQVNLHGHISHHQALSLSTESDVFLLITTAENHPATSEVMTGKVFEALGLRKRCLALTHSAPLKQLIQDSGLGTVCDPGSTEQITGALVSLYEEWKHSKELKTRVDEAVRKSYDRKQQAESLSDLMHDLEK